MQHFRCGIRFRFLSFSGALVGRAEFWLGVQEWDSLNISDTTKIGASAPAIQPYLGSIRPDYTELLQQARLIHAVHEASASSQWSTLAQLLQSPLTSTLNEQSRSAYFQWAHCRIQESNCCHVLKALSNSTDVDNLRRAIASTDAIRTRLLDCSPVRELDEPTSTALRLAEDRLRDLDLSLEALRSAAIARNPTQLRQSLDRARKRFQSETPPHAEFTEAAMLLERLESCEADIREAITKLASRLILAELKETASRLKLSGSTVMVQLDRLLELAPEDFEQWRLEQAAATDNLCMLAEARLERCLLRYKHMEAAGRATEMDWRRFPRLKHPAEWVAQAWWYRRTASLGIGMLKYSDTGIHSSLTRIAIPSESAQAIIAFEHVRMAERAIEDADVKFATANLTCMGRQYPALRDEIFIQLMKQLNEAPAGTAPKMHSLFRYWSVLEHPSTARGQLLHLLLTRLLQVMLDGVSAIGAYIRVRFVLPEQTICRVASPSIST